MGRFLIVVEKAGSNFSAYSPDLPGCVATGATPDETKANMRSAVDRHVQGLREDRLPIPEPTATAEYAEAWTSPRAMGPATEEDLRHTPEDGYKHELVDGQLRRSPGGYRHGSVSVQIGARLAAFVEERQLGYVFATSTGFRFPGGNVRLPDVSFVAKGRIPGEELTDDFSDVPPDLAIEVISPEDRVRDVYDRIGEYLQVGVPLVWVVDPEQRAAAVYRSVTDVHRVEPEDFLDGEEVVPGFRCRLAEVID